MPQKIEPDLISRIPNLWSVVKPIFSFRYFLGCFSLCSLCCSLFNTVSLSLRDVVEFGRCIIFHIYCMKSYTTPRSFIFTVRCIKSPTYNIARLLSIWCIKFVTYCVNLKFILKFRFILLVTLTKPTIWAHLADCLWWVDRFELRSTNFIEIHFYVICKW